MTMSLLRDEGVESYFVTDNQMTSPGSSGFGTGTRRNDVPLVEAKMRRPEISEVQVQRRLADLLKRSVQNHVGTLVVGRAGAGKTTLVADLACRVPDSAWYSIDAGDADWTIFSRYFRALVRSAKGKDSGKRTPATAARTPLELFAGQNAVWPELLVLDGVHHLFDSDWFTEFFQLLLASLRPPSHVLMLSRSKPPTPLWRLRSKQVLSVIDEKVLAFSPAETAELFARHGIDEVRAEKAHNATFGRAGKLAAILKDLTDCPATK